MNREITTDVDVLSTSKLKMAIVAVKVPADNYSIHSLGEQAAARVASRTKFPMGEGDYCRDCKRNGVDYKVFIVPYIEIKKDRETSLANQGWALNP